MEIRSYRAVFELERRIYRVDRLRLNPGGVPLRGVAYFLALLAASAVARRLPGVSLLAGLAPWYLGYVAAPAAAAAVLTAIKIEGRPFHIAAQALAGYRLRPSCLACWRACERGMLEEAHTARARWRPPELVLLPDGSDPHLRRLRYTGPGAVLVRVSHERVEPVGPVIGRRARLRLRERPDRRPLESGQVIALARGTHLRVR
jgi:hypothetical protein